MIELGMRELMRLSDVRRWHTVRVVREQTLADHSCRVALIALRLHGYWVGRTNNADRAALLTAGLLHDMAEIRIGDPPPAGKTAEYLALEDECMRAAPPGMRLSEQPSAQIMATVKMADRIEAWLWIRENAVGEHSQSVVSRCSWVMEQMAADFKATESVMNVIEEILGEKVILCPF